jgi:hypothetical protein
MPTTAPPISAEPNGERKKRLTLLIMPTMMALGVEPFLNAPQRLSKFGGRPSPV